MISAKRTAQPVQICLPWPPSVNHYWRSDRGGRPHISDEGKAYRVGVAMLTNGTHALTGRLSVEILAFPPDGRRRDLDNLLKAPLDALGHDAAYHDDSQIDELMIKRMPPDKHEPRIIVRLMEIG